MMLDELGQRIRNQRDRLGLKQQDVANALQVSPQAVSKWERGENAPDITILAALARLLGVSTDWLLDAHTERRDVFQATVLVSSINGAYEKSQGMASRDYAVWANGILFQVTESVLKYEGVPIKCIGDGLLAFFSGSSHAARAVKAAFLAREMVAEDLRIGLNEGDIFLGAVGHPDYARPDIMGQAVNGAFAAADWACSKSTSGLACTSSVLEAIPGARTGRREEIDFKGVPQTLTVCELVAQREQE